MTHIVILSDAIRKVFAVYLDYKVENCFYATEKEGFTKRFSCDKRGLYILEAFYPVDYCVCGSSHGTYVEGFTQKEVERGKFARQLYHDLNAEGF